MFGNGAHTMSVCSVSLRLIWLQQGHHIVGDGLGDGAVYVDDDDTVVASPQKQCSACNDGFIDTKIHGIATIQKGKR